MSDKDIQELLDRDPNAMIPGSEDYRELFEKLDTAPGKVRLTPGFAHRVTARIQEKRTADPVRRWTILLAVIGLLCSVTVIAVLANFSLEFNLPQSTGFNLYIAFFMLLLAIGGTQYADFRKRKRQISD